MKAAHKNAGWWENALEKPVLNLHSKKKKKASVISSTAVAE